MEYKVYDRSIGDGKSLSQDTEIGINRLRCTSGHHDQIIIATIASLGHRPTTDSGTDIPTMVRHALAKVGTVPVLLVALPTL